MKSTLATETRTGRSLKRLVRRQWRCFHCDEVFKAVGDAAAHFGGNLCDTPACKIDATALRELEKQLAAYRSEDTDLHRQMRHMESEHQIALRREEERGYAKGLRDGRALASNKKLSV